MAQIESFVLTVREWAYENRRALFWMVVSVVTLWVMIASGEITALLLVSFFIAVLLEPAVLRLQKLGFGRPAAIFAIGILAIAILCGIILLVVPSVAEQYSILIHQLPDYIGRLFQKVVELAGKVGITIPSDPKNLTAKVREGMRAVGTEQLSIVANQAYVAVLSGYSLTMMVLNIILIPFFVYYISVDLHHAQSTILSIFKPRHAHKIAAVSSEIMGHVYAFFQGQVTVALCLVVLYSLGLFLIGVPSALAIGVLSGVLGIVPYLGILIGLLLASLITLVTDPSITQLLLVWGVFGLVQFLEGTFITPKVMEEKMGLHPLEVMVALLVGAKLFGLLGLLLAVPGVAATRVLFRHVKREVEETPPAQVVVTPL